MFNSVKKHFLYLVSFSIIYVFILFDSRTKLAKLFEGGGNDDNVSLKYTPPKETKMQSSVPKPSKAPVFMKVCLGKTVEAFKM